MTTLLVFYILSMLICIYGLIKNKGKILSLEMIVCLTPIINSIVAWVYFVEPYRRKK